MALPAQSPLQSNILPKQSVKLPPLLFDGPHSDSYELLIGIEFVVDGEKLTLTYNYVIADYGNLAWHDQYVSF